MRRTAGLRSPARGARIVLLPLAAAAVMQLALMQFDADPAARAGGVAPQSRAEATCDELLALHAQLFKALDARDPAGADAAFARFGPGSDRRLFVVDGAGRSRGLEGVDAPRELAASWNSIGTYRAPTMIRDHRVVLDVGSSVVVAFEIEREHVHLGVRRWRVTSVLRRDYAPDDAGEAMVRAARICHLHISAAEPITSDRR